MQPTFVKLADYFGAHRSENRDAHERDRARQRAAISGGFGLVIAAGAWFTGSATTLHLVIAGMSAIYTLVALAYLKRVLLRGRSPLLGQYAFIVLDPMLTVLVLVAAPEWLAAFYAVLIVQVVRTGMRYGLRTMWLAWAAACAAAAALMPFSPFWLAEQQMLRSFVVMMLVVPVLFGPLIRRLHAVTDELRTAAGSDALTGLGNRRLLAEHLSLAKERSQRDGTMLAVILFDLDNFKAVNDTLGHAAGDLLLERLARAVRANCRAGDFLARVGGDEFVLLVEGLSMLAGRAQARDIAQKIVGVIQETAERVAPGTGVSASVGVHCWSHALDPAISEGGLVESADRAMYAAKQAGKSQVVLAAA